MPEPDPKAALAKASKLLHTAKEALAETEKIQRLKTLVEAERAALIDKADPEDRTAMRKLGELNAELQVIPTRLVKARERQTAAGFALAEVADELSLVITQLLDEEKTRRLDEWEAVLMPDFPNRLLPNGEISQDRRIFAGKIPVFAHIEERATPRFRMPSQSPACFQNDPQGSLPDAIAAVEDMQLILAEYFANRKSFRSPDFKKEPISQ